MTTLCIERLEKWIAHVVELPGCFSADLERERAIDGVADPVIALDVVRARFHADLAAFRRFDGIAVRHGEIWSARKVLRRALWHERDHIGHVLRAR